MALSKDCLKHFADLIEQTIGIVYGETNYYQLETRLEDVSKLLGMSGPTELWEKSQRGQLTAPMKLLLVDIATNNETSFFRDPNVFKAIRSIVEQSREGQRAESPFRVWSAACSSGQEIYSLAMLFQEIKDQRPFFYNIHASDISDRMLRRAQDGIYTQLEVQRGLSAAQLGKYFRPQAMTPGSASDAVKTWEIHPDIRRGLTFQKLNLLDSWTGLGQFQLILCRNVLIYQSVENKKKVITKLNEHLEAGGYIILGGAESLIGLSDTLEYVALEGAVVYRKPTQLGVQEKRVI
jgi:chemotaxis protein methyltransferase CheR